MVILKHFKEAKKVLESSKVISFQKVKLYSYLNNNVMIQMQKLQMREEIAQHASLWSTLHKYVNEHPSQEQERRCISFPDSLHWQETFSWKSHKVILKEIHLNHLGFMSIYNHKDPRIQLLEHPHCKCPQWDFYRKTWSIVSTVETPFKNFNIIHSRTEYGQRKYYFWIFYRDL